MFFAACRDVLEPIFCFLTPEDGFQLLCTCASLEQEIRSRETTPGQTIWGQTESWISLDAFAKLFQKTDGALWQTVHLRAPDNGTRQLVTVYNSSYVFVTAHLEASNLIEVKVSLQSFNPQSQQVFTQRFNIRATNCGFKLSGDVLRSLRSELKSRLANSHRPSSQQFAVSVAIIKIAELSAYVRRVSSRQTRRPV